MAVVVEALAFAGAFFNWYNTSRKVPVTLRGLVRFLFFCVIIVLVLRIAFIGRRRPFCGRFFILQKNKISLSKALTIYSICTIMYIESERGIAMTNAQTKATKKWNKNNREHRNYLSKRSSARSFIRNHATMNDLNELEEIIKEKKEELEMITEKQLQKALEDNFENFKDDMAFEEYADMLDFWVDKDGDILVEERGMEPVDGVKKVGYVDNGEVYVY